MDYINIKGRPISGPSGAYTSITWSTLTSSQVNWPFFVLKVLIDLSKYSAAASVLNFRAISILSDRHNGPNEYSVLSILVESDGIVMINVCIIYFPSEVYQFIEPLYQKGEVYKASPLLTFVTGINRHFAGLALHLSPRHSYQLE